MKSVDEFSVNTIEIGGIGAALKALRLPFGKECRSSQDFTYNTDVKESWELNVSTHSEILINPQDIQLISTLIKRGDEHSKILRGIVVWCEINAPRYWWQEMDTYRVGAERLSSESTMHIQGKGLSTKKLVEMKENLPEGTMQKRVWMFSYQTLRRIYKQRYNHRLPQWRKFCIWIENLPFAKQLILSGYEDLTVENLFVE